jgi:DNA-directed RNA polymerase specialized sigma24 family protein
VSAKKKTQPAPPDCPDEAHGDEAPEPFWLANRLALRPSEAAKALGVSERHLRSHLSEIPHDYIGNRLVFPVDAVRERLCERAKARVQAQAEAQAKQWRKQEDLVEEALRAVQAQRGNTR